MSPILEDFSIAGGLVAVLLVGLEAGFRAGRRAGSETDSAGQVGAIQGAVLGLLGLLLAFSFAAAGARFMERQDLIVQEANAIGTAYLRADLLDEPQRSALRSALKRYTEHRVAVSRKLRNRIEPAALEEAGRLQNEIWQAARAGVAARPGTMLGVLPPVNELIDLHTTRLAAMEKHLPGIVLALLIASSVLATGVMGYGSGLGGRGRRPLGLVLVTLIGAALWLTIDLDHPRSGMIRLNDAPLESLDFGKLP